MNAEQKEELCKVAFELFDTDKSGFIDEAELITVISQIYQEANQTAPNPEDIKKLFKEIDTNKNGKISFEELKTLIEKLGF